MGTVTYSLRIAHILYKCAITLYKCDLVGYRGDELVDNHCYKHYVYAICAMGGGVAVCGGGGGLFCYVIRGHSVIMTDLPSVESKAV